MRQQWRRIGELGREVGLKIPTIRYYEEIGLMPPPERSAGDWRVYDQKSADRLSFIKHARGLGLSIDEVRALLRLVDAPDRPCGEAVAIARSQLTVVNRKLEQLNRLRAELERMSRDCAGTAARECQVISALATPAVDQLGSTSRVTGSAR